jgi:hypothetical protein
MLSDVTIERLAALLASAAPKGVLMIRDELAGWLLGMNAYNDRAPVFWLEAYGGRGYMLYRPSSPNQIIIPRLAVSWYGDIQPSLVAQVIQGADHSLLTRFMWFWPVSVPFDIPRSPAIEWAISALDRLRMLDLVASEDGLTPLTVPLDTAAAQRLVRFAQSMRERQKATTGLMRSTIAKARGHALRLSLVLEYLRWCGEDRYSAPPDTISDDAMLAATKLVDEYAIPMADRLYRYASMKIAP